MDINSHKPNLLMKAVFSWSDPLIGIDQNASHKSMVEKYFADPNATRISSILGKGYESCFVTLLRALKSTQKRIRPFFLSASSIGAAHAEVEGLITFLFAIVSICFHIIYLRE